MQVTVLQREPQCWLSSLTCVFLQPEAALSPDIQPLTILFQARKAWGPRNFTEAVGGEAGENLVRCPITNPANLCSKNTLDHEVIMHDDLITTLSC